MKTILMRLDMENTDELYYAVLNYILEGGRISSGGLQLEFGVSYKRGLSLIKQLEDNGIISSPDFKGVRRLL